jgi:pre-mRNA-splicing factor SYF2
MSAQDRLEKLKQLQKRKAEGSRQNRQELFKEHRQQSIGKQLEQLRKRQEKAQEELDSLESKEQGEDSHRKKVWDYTIEDNEKWDAKQEMRKSNKKNAGFKNYSQMAEQSYKKEIGMLEVDKEKYKGHKDKEQDNHRPSREAIDTLVDQLTTSDSRRMKRKKRDDVDSYSEYLFVLLIRLRQFKILTASVNDKNKQFNEKLNRHYDKYK